MSQGPGLRERKKLQTRQLIAEAARRLFAERGFAAVTVAGESLVAAFGRFVLEPRGLLAAEDPETVEWLAAIARVIEESPALLAREQRIFAGYTDSLAALLAEETHADAGDVSPWVAANALMGVHRALVAHTRRAILAGARNPQLARRVRTQARRALALLERGLGDYATRD